MKKLTEKCKDLLGNIEIAIEDDLSQVFTVRRAAEHNTWSTAKYPVVFGYVASAMSAVKHGLLERVGHNAFRLTDAGRAAIAANVSADAAPAWTPKPGMLVRFKQGVQLSGDNPDVNAIQGMGVVGKITRASIIPPYDWSVSFGLDGDYNCMTDELEPASESAPDAAQTAAAGDVEPDYPPGYQKVGYNHDSMSVSEKNAQIARLTRDLEAARTEAAALRAHVDRVERAGAIAQQVSDERLSTLMDETDKLVVGLDNISPMEGLTRLLSFRRVYNEFVQELHRAEAQTDAALASARQRADSDPATWLTTADVRAQSEFAEDD